MMRYAYMVPIAFISLQPHVVKANTIPEALKEKIIKCNQEDHDLVQHGKKREIIGWWDKKYEPVISQFNDKIIDELDWIRIFYGHPPLSPSKRMRVRSKIVHLIENEKLTQEEYDFLMYVLTYYKCI